MSGIKFKCTQCGACCKKVGEIQSKDFPQNFVKRDGSCIHLLADNSCRIYDTRPDICKVHKWYKAQTRKKRTAAGEKNPLYRLSRKEYYKANNLMCNKLQSEAGMPIEYRIDLGVYDKPALAQGDSPGGAGHVQ